MKVIYSIVETTAKTSCAYCPNVGEGEAFCGIRFRNVDTNSYLGQEVLCEKCKTKIENNQIPSCDGCGRFLRRSDADGCF
jgi:hypothetical protein